MLDLIHIRSRSAWKHWPEEAGWMILTHWLASRPDHFSGWPKRDSQPEPNRIRPGFVQYIKKKAILGHLWKNATESKSGKLVAGWLHSARNQAQWFLHTGFWTRCVWPKPDQAIQTRSGSVLPNMDQASFGKAEPNQMGEVRSGIYGPAWFWLQAGCVWRP